MMARSTFVFMALGALLVLVSASCNAILDNNEGRLVQKDSGASEGRCPFGQKECGGACVDLLNPAFGCQAGDCTACELKSTLEYKCAGVKDGLECGVAACFDRYFNCDAKNPTGCEVDLRKVGDCGRCGEVCNAPDYCDSYSTIIRCVPVCPEGSTRCDADRQCINPMTDIANCGGCGKTCPAPPGTIPTCDVGACGFRCDAARGFRDCGGTCVQESVDACGPSCTKCPVPDGNHTMACENGKCTEKCKFPTCNGACVPPEQCKSTCGQNPVDCGSGKCDTDICTTTACGGCNMPCIAPGGPNITASCAPPDPTNPNCHCVTKCEPPAVQCPIGGCVVPNANPNCGACGRDCSTLHQYCMGSACGTCLPDWIDCDSNTANGCEVNIAQFTASGTNPHCGGCNKPCANCTNGVCQGGDGGTDGGIDGGPQEAGVGDAEAPP